MSLTKLLKAPIKLFKKDVITFLIIHRYDLGIINQKLQYIAMRPSASISVLRRKVWHLLDLPDYCEEIIVLKTQPGVEIPLTELRRGNDPQCPYILEVWMPETSPDCTSSVMFNNMLKLGKNLLSTTESIRSYDEKKEVPEKTVTRCTANYKTSTETIAQIKHRVADSTGYPNVKAKSELSCKSKSSLFRISVKKSQDNFINILLKIQSDLSTLSNKICVLENKIIN